MQTLSTIPILSFIAWYLRFDFLLMSFDIDLQSALPALRESHKAPAEFRAGPTEHPLANPTMGWSEFISIHMDGPMGFISFGYCRPMAALMASSGLTE
jgi:hypothetical protein